MTLATFRWASATGATSEELTVYEREQARLL